MKLIIFGVTFFLANRIWLFAAQPCDLGTREERKFPTGDCLVEAPKVGSEMFFVLGVSRQEVGAKFEEWLNHRNQQDFSFKPGFFYFNEMCELSRRLGFNEESPEEEQINNDIRRYLEHCRILHPYGEFKGTESVIGFIAYAFGISVQIWEKQQSTIRNIRRYNPNLDDSSEKTVSIVVEQGRVFHLVSENSAPLERKRAQYLREISILSVDLLKDTKFLWRIQKHYFPEFQAHLSWLDTYVFLRGTLDGSEVI